VGGNGRSRLWVSLANALGRLSGRFFATPEKTAALRMTDSCKGQTDPLPAERDRRSTSPLLAQRAREKWGTHIRKLLDKGSAAVYLT